MKCVYCSCEESKVIDSRSTDDGETIRRRRECIKCAKRFTTYEKVDRIPLVVIKKDDSRQQFDREKLLSGLLRACEKRPVSLEQLETVVDTIENKLFSLEQREIQSNRIGDEVLKMLENIDPVAYVRFASVYKEFQDIESFMNELKKFISKK